MSLCGALHYDSEQSVDNDDMHHYNIIHRIHNYVYGDCIEKLEDTSYIKHVQFPNQYNAINIVNILSRLS